MTKWCIFVTHENTKTQGVSSAMLSTIRTGVVGQLATIVYRPFEGASIQIVEKEFLETIGESGARGLTELFARNNETNTTIVYDGQKHYRKHLAMGRYLTLLGEISLRRGIYQSNKPKRSIFPLELKLRFINDYVSFVAAEYICYSLATMTLGEFVKYCKKWTLMKPSEGTARRVLYYVGHFLEASDFLVTIHSKETVLEKAVTLAMSIDSTSVLIRREGWHHTAATVSTYDAQDNRLHTVYIGRMPETRKTKTERRLLEKEVEARMAIHQFKHIVCIADGTHEISRYFR